MKKLGKRELRQRRQEAAGRANRTRDLCNMVRELAAETGTTDEIWESAYNAVLNAHAAAFAKREARFQEARAAEAEAWLRRQLATLATK
jgi:hypothetical protein